MKNDPKKAKTFYYIIAVIWLFTAITWCINKNYPLGALNLSLAVVYFSLAYTYREDKGDKKDKKNKK